MAGHSHAANVAHRKAAQNAQKAIKFTKFANLITLAAQKNPNPDLNPTLKTAIENAKKAGMPNDNIERAIQRAVNRSKNTDMMQEIFYEGYGPHNVPMIIKCVTDNTNRSLTNVRTIFNKNGGNFGVSIMWMFDFKGVIEIENVSSISNIEEIIIESGADDYNIYENIATIYTNPESLKKVKDFFESKSIPIKSAQLMYVRKDSLDITENQVNDILAFIDKLKEDDDVVDVYF